MITRCPSCERGFRLNSPRFVGKQANCPNCGERFVIELEAAQPRRDRRGFFQSPIGWGIIAASLVVLGAGSILAVQLTLPEELPPPQPASPELVEAPVSATGGRPDQVVFEAPREALEPVNHRESVADESVLTAEDWPSWRGPRRDGLSTETGLLKEWPREGPSLAWKVAGLGEGYSTPSIAGDTLFVLGTKDDGQYLIALDLKDGRRRWDTRLGRKSGGGGYPGPRATPTVDGDRVYALGSDGSLVAVKRKDGEVLWSKDLRKDFRGDVGGWEYSESPLIDGDSLICTPGGEHATLVSLNKLDGSEIWTASARPLVGGGYSRAAYSSPIVATFDGVKQYVQFFHGGVIGFSAKDGKPLWHYDHPANGTANCSTPIAHDGSVFATSSYGAGGGKAKITRQGDEFHAEEEFFNRKMQNHHGGMLLIKDHLYGTNNSMLLCVDWKTGEVVWEDRSVGKGSVVFADGHLYVRSEGGQVALVAADPTGYREKGRFSQPDRSGKSAWAHPVVAGKRLYLRDWDVLLCYDIGTEQQ